MKGYVLMDHKMQGVSGVGNDAGVGGEGRECMLS